MGANSLLQLLTDAVFLLIFIATLRRAIAFHRRANIDTLLLFSAVALIIGFSALESLVTGTNAAVTFLVLVLLIALPYLQLRLVDDFASVPPWLMRGAFACLILAAIAFGVIELPGGDAPLSLPLVLVIVAYFVGLEVYEAVRFVREARRTSGVTRRRMQSVALGTLMLGLVILVAGFQAAIPSIKGFAAGLSLVLGLLSGAGYYLGFAPPNWLRRAWQEPELRAFLGRAARLPRLPDTQAIVRELEMGAASSLGAPRATVGLWDDHSQVLRFDGDHGPFEIASGEMLAGEAFAAQQPLLTDNAERDDAEHADLYRLSSATAVLCAPITAGTRRLGVLIAFAPRAPIFAEDDLRLVQLLADQAAVILESRALIDEAARVRGREEAARLKDDFLSSAAHDLKTPLTTVIAQAQLLERRAVLHPAEPPDIEGLQRLVRESRRLNGLVLELLDASRLDQGSLVGERTPHDLVQIAREVCEHTPSDRHRCMLEAEQPVFASVDRIRMSQVVMNLVDNAVKFSPQGGDVFVRVWREGGEAHLTVTDQGIGIPLADLPVIFSRFHRGSNVDDRRFAGMGLGLYICRQIAEQHGGRIWASSRVNGGSTFHVVLPAMESPNND